MRTAKRRRCDRLEGAIGQIPFRPEVLSRAFQHFCNTGELPENDDRMAQAILERAHRGGKEADIRELSNTARILLEVVTAQEAANPAQPSVRDCLFYEALHETPFARKLARLAIELLVFLDGDVCDPAFGAEKGLPTHGTVGMHVMEWDKRLAKPPYEEQAARLFRRMDELRAKLDYTKDDWWDPIRDALLAFVNEGTLPPEGPVGEWVFALVEYDCLWRHRRGEDVAELMAALDAVACGTAEERAAALGRAVDVARRCGVIRGE